MMAVLAIKEVSPRVTEVIHILSGPKVDHARNQMFHKWLNETDCDYLLMLDSDMVPPANTVERLLAHRKDIVGGLCFTGSLSGEVRPTIHITKEVEGGWTLDIMWDYPENSLVRVAGTGGACMLIHRDVAEGVLKARGEDHPMPWFAHGLHNGVEIGEDIAFCLTAQKCGYEVWVDTGLEVPHVKTAFITSAEYVQALSDERHPYYNRREEVPVYGSVGIPDKRVESKDS